MTEIQARFHETLIGLPDRVLVLEQEIKSHERIAVIVFTIVAALGILSFIELNDWLKARIKRQLKPVIEEAKKEIADRRTTMDAQGKELDRIKTQTISYLEVLKKAVSLAPNAPDHLIQSGELEVQFSNTNYISMEVKFPKPFPSVPKVFVGEGRGGSWLIVKVDSKDENRFSWAANNLLGVSTYKTIIQWFAIADLPPHDDAAPAAPPPPTPLPPERAAK
jgi:hypothetical protein